MYRINNLYIVQLTVSILKFELDIFSKSTGVVVDVGLGIAERLQ